MDNKIKILPDDLINKIAAGEVVERPSSIVKELMENSIDAGATEITLTLENSGLDAITISDNGSGMSDIDAEKSLLQHATSKIKTEEDLYKISTMGFRGEALASIASISEVSIHTFNNKDNPITLISSSGSTEKKVGPSRVQGTTVRASKIFSKIPARRKFLKSPVTEYKYILDTFQNIVLSEPQIKFKLVKNDKTVIELPKRETLLERIIDVFPAFNKNDLIRIDNQEPNYNLEGFIATTDFANTNISKQYLFLNNRFIKSALISKAIKEGYRTAVMPQINPSYFIFLKFSPNTYDVNVHPRKIEVRFEDTNKVFRIIKNTIQYGLEKSLKETLENKFSTTNKATRPNSEAYNFFNPKPTSIKQSMAFTKEILSESPGTTPSTTINTRPTVQTSFQPSVRAPIQSDLQSDTMDSYIGDYLQIFNTYILIPKDQKLIMIDQHAANERINFERIKKSLDTKGTVDTQQLLIPEKINLDRYEATLIRENLDLFKKIGFDFAQINNSFIEISQIPLLLQHSSIKEAIIEIITELKDSEIPISQKYETLKTKLISTLACHSSIRAGQRLSRPEVIKLIKDLFDCEFPNSCPHGRPITWEISRTEIEKNFKRKL